MPVGQAVFDWLRNTPAVELLCIVKQHMTCVVLTVYLSNLQMGIFLIVMMLEPPMCKERIKHVKSVGAIRGMSLNFMFDLSIRTTKRLFANHTAHSFLSSVYEFISSICTRIFYCCLFRN